jgi:hypothetical protein
MRARIWIFTAVVTLALALNLARVSLSIAQTGEDTMRARVAAASTALRGQLDLLDARLAPRAVAMMPDLIEVVRGGEGQPPTRPDERALRAAGSVLAPEPDLFAVASPHGAVVSRRARPVQMIDDSAQLPLAQTASGAMLAPTFAPFDGAVYRFAAARVPGAAAAAVVGTLVDDRFAAQLKSQVDADVTLLQGGRIVASSLPQGEERTRLTRWATAPGPGYGVLQIRLPFVATALSGMLPRGATRYAVRGALIPLDGGVQAALTVPASPYLAWLGRYQAFYLVGLAVLVLFAFVWGLFARAPAPVIQQVSAPPGLFEPEDGVVSPPRRAPRMPSPMGTDVSEPQSAPKKSRDASWPPGERPSGERRFVGNASAVTAIPAGERLDPDLSPAAAAPQDAAPSVAGGEAEAVGDSAVWGADAPASGPFTSPAPTSGGAVPDWDMPAPPAPASASAEGDQKRDFGFGDPLDPPVPPPAEAFEPATADGSAQPAAEEPPAEPFPGDEPTRSEGVSAALMDKLRERDEELRAQADGEPQSSDTLQDFMPPAQDSDPDEPHWRETYDRFCELKEQLGEPADRISFERFAAKLKKNRAELVAKHNCKGVRFSVYEKEGKAAIKASAIR